MRSSTRLGALVLALALTAGACGSEEAGVDTDTDITANGADAESSGTIVDTMTDEDFVEFLAGLSDEEFEEYTADLDDEEYDRLLEQLDAYRAGDGTGATPVDAGGTRDDVDCSQEGLGADDTTTFTTARYVVDGVLGDVCLGEADERLTAAWDALATITPTGQLADLGVFTGFESTEDGEEVTLAFVNALDADGSLFQMSVNLDTYADDPNEAQLTMAHEFSHVFTSLPSQLDRAAEAEDACTTYYNGEGCYLADSIMYQWIETFWGDGLIDQIDPFAEATGADGQGRCDADPGFFGAYAASTPEEDFAESFSVYVFDVETFTAEQQARIDWIAAQPGLAEFRARAEAAGVTGLQNNFDECGLG